MSSVIVSGARTPIGKLSGTLSQFTAMDLGGFAIKQALINAGISPEEVDYVFMGHVIQAGQGQITARQAAFKGGIPMSIPSTTVNKVCLSGLNSIYLASKLIEAGDAEIVIAGGMESMTKAPYILRDARSGYRAGDGTLVDSMMYDGLFCAFDQVAMGLGTERYAKASSIPRQRQDEIAALSHERAAEAIKSNKFKDEIVAVQVPQRKGDPTIVDTDEGVRPGTTVDSLNALKPAFEKEGTITAGNASQISDGGAAVVVMSKELAQSRGLDILCEIVGYGQVAGPDPSLLNQPSNAIKKALSKSGISQNEVKLYEINEAFAAVAAASMDDLGVNEEVVNVNGGAIALGHPVGMSGTRLAITLSYELKRRSGGIGAAALCGGGGQGDALLIKVS